MQKLFFIIVCIFTLTSGTYAAKKDVLFEFYKNGKRNENTQVDRTVIRFPNIIAVYDDTDKTINIMGDEDIEASIYILDNELNIVDYSNSINTIFYLPISSQHFFYVYIEGDIWCAYTIIEI